MPLATIIMLSSYIWLAWSPIERVLSDIRTIGRSYESYVRMREVLDDPDVYSDGETDYRYGSGDIEFKDLSFGYTEAITVLDNLSIRFE